MERICFLSRIRPGRLDSGGRAGQAPDEGFLRLAEVFHLD
jgi:hypothetical protein